MLFDLEDYRSLKVIGTDHKPVEQINWEEPYTIARGTRDAYLKAINEYFLSSQVMSTKEEMIVLNTKMNNILESNLVLNPLLKDFFNAMSSLAILPGQAINEGDRYKFIYVPINDTSVDWFECTQPTAGTPISWDTYMNEGSKKVAVLEQEGDIYYKEMTQVLYDSYNSAFVDFQSKVKDLIVVSEGGVENFNDYVAPAVPAWDSYPELSGYVRGTNNLTIKNAVVRLIDADGANHDLVTDDNGYYKFDKEMFYNNIAFDHTDDMSNFKMLLLENVVGSTASLYDKTSKFENSFFGAENNRSLTWEVSIKMGKQARRNFKLDFIPDYSNFPSFSGHVLDQDGNPVQNALVLIKDHNSGYAIGHYQESNGNIVFAKKYDYFGIERTILTDINGYYEYPSQMVGEWFTKHGFVAPFKIYALTNPQITWNDNGTDRYSNEFVTYLIPYVQDPLTNELLYDGDISARIYDNHDWFNSRFQYALNDQNVFYYTTIEMGHSYNLDVNETIVDIESGAERIYFTPDPGVNYPEGCMAVYGIATTTGFFKVKWADGSEEIMGWPGNVGYNNSTVLISFQTAETEPFYVYSCNGVNGAADGKIWRIEDANGRNQGDLTSFDIEELTDLRSLYFNSSPLKTFDCSSPALSNLEKLEVLNSFDFQLVNLEQLTSTKDLYIDLDGKNYSKNEISTTNFIRKYRPEDIRNNQVTTWFNSEVFKSKMLENGDILVVGSMNIIAFSRDYVEIPVNRIALIKPNYDIVPFYNNNEHQFNGNVKNFEILEDGSIIVIGDFTSVKKSDGTSFSTFGVAKLTSNGLIDESFMNNLINPTDHNIVINGNFDFSNIIISPDGKIILGNTVYNDWSSIGVNTYTNYDNTENNYIYWGDFVSSQEYYSVIRINTNGSIDNTFNAYKQTEPDSTISHFGHVRGAIYGLVPYSTTQFFIHGSGQNKRYIDANGNLYESGIYQPIILMDYDGNIDIESAANLYINTTNVNINSLKIQTDGKILLSGYLSAFIPNIDPNLAAYQITKLAYGACATLARLNSDFTVDEDFMNNILVHNDDSLKIDLLSNGDIRLKGHSGSRYFDPATGNTDDFYSQIVTLNNDGTIKSKEYPSFYGGSRSVVDIYETETYSIVIGGFYQMQDGKGNNVYGGGVAKLNKAGFETLKLELPDTLTNFVRVQNNKFVNEIILKSTDEFIINGVYDLKKIDLSHITNINKISISSINNTRPVLHIGNGDISMVTELSLDWPGFSDLSFLSNMIGLKKLIYRDSITLPYVLDLSSMSGLEELRLRCASEVNLDGLSSLKILELNNMPVSGIELSPFAGSLEELYIYYLDSLPDLGSLPLFTKLNKMDFNGSYGNNKNILIQNNSLKILQTYGSNSFLTLDTPNIEQLIMGEMYKKIEFSSTMPNLWNFSLNYAYFTQALDFSKMPNVSRISMQQSMMTSIDLSVLTAIQYLTIYYWGPCPLLTFTMPSSYALDSFYTYGWQRSGYANQLLLSIWTGLASHSNNYGYVSYSGELNNYMTPAIQAYRNSKPHWNIGLN